MHVTSPSGTDLYVSLGVVASFVAAIFGLSRADPLYVIPILMGLSMFALSWIGQRGMPPNPQTKMMLYLMPGMMTFLFLRFASGLNLYYTVMNLASLPQQWLLARERLRRNPAPPPVPPKPKPLSGKK